MVSAMPESNVDLGVLIGMLLTDGSVSKKGNSWDIEFSGKSKELHELFKEKMKKVFRINNFTEISDSRHKEIKRTKISNKNIGEQLLQFTSFRTKQFENGKFPDSKIPNFIFNLCDDEVCEILKMMFSCDGSISLWVVWNKRWNLWEIKKWIKFACKHPTIRKQVFNLLQKLDYEPIIREENDEILLTKKKDIIRFASEIRFVNGVKVTKDSRNWEGYEKNQILNLSIKTYSIKQNELKDFKSKEELYNFLKHLISA